MSFRTCSFIVMATLLPGYLVPAKGVDGNGFDNDEPRSDQEVAALVDRCFAGYLRYDNTTLKRSFIEGDFDGDGSKDLFAAVKPARKVNTNDKSKPPFTYQEVLDSTSPASAAIDLRLGNLGLVEVWPLFVVIRNVDKPAPGLCLLQKEKYLLLFPMDKGVNELKLFKGQKLPPGTIGDPKEDAPPPALKGDAVLLLDPGGDGQAIFWGGGRFRWYPVNDYHGVVPPRYRAMRKFVSSVALFVFLSNTTSAAIERQFNSTATEQTTKQRSNNDEMPETQVPTSCEGAAARLDIAVIDTQKCPIHI